MVESLHVIIGFCLEIVGCVGCFVPILPGPWLSFVGVICFMPTRFNPGWSLVAGMAILALAATILDYIVPAVGARRFKCSGLGVFGCVVGSVIGVFFFPIGMFLGCARQYQ